MRTKNDPNTGQFAKGNPGRTKGTKNARTLQWEELGREITETNAARFNEVLGRLWDGDLAEQVRAAELFLKMVEFFKPKLQRITLPVGQPQVLPPLLVQDGMAKIPDNWPGPVIRIHRGIIERKPEEQGTE